MTKDYSITLQDNTGRQVTLFIVGDEIDAAIESGLSPEQAREASENNQAENAIYRKQIDADCWLAA